MRLFAAYRFETRTTRRELLYGSYDHVQRQIVLTVNIIVVYPRARFAKDVSCLQFGQKTPTDRVWGSISAGL
jgi:hypothetical protein